MFMRVNTPVLTSFAISPTTESALSPTSAADAGRSGGRSFFGRARSTNEVPSMAAIATMHISNGATPTSDELPNTLPDPRTPSPTPRLRSPVSNGDLAGEVSVLSTKLINAINHNTNLDEALQQVRHELDTTRKRVEELEQQKSGHDRDITDGVLLKKAEVDANMAHLRAELEQARRERESSDKAKKEMEMEVENLTASLFEQANTMVADARRGNEAAEKKNTQLRSQLQDTETLVASQQEQLHDLKAVMEKMNSERDETESALQFPTAPSTPATDANKMSRIMDAIPSSPANGAESQLEPPLRYTHLIVPVLRSDLQAYHDFVDLLATSKALNQLSHSRSPSGQLRATNSPGVGSIPAASSSSPNLPGSFNTPLTPTVISPRDVTSPHPPLKDSKFFKRCLTEDIEPALRLDLAPGLSWLARRNVSTSIMAGALVIEPLITASSRTYGPVYACALCGEDRKDQAYARRHRFRTSEDISAQRYPLCEYCTNRLRATCDFAAFLRMCRDGLWKTNTEDDMRSAWEEGVRLRERMFWARIGGGVVPYSTAREGHREMEKAKEDASSKTEGVTGTADAGDSGSNSDADGNRIVLTQPSSHRAQVVRLSTPPNRRSISVDASRQQDRETQGGESAVVERTEEASAETQVPN